MTPLIQGIQVGLLLCLLLGPIFIIFVQVSIEKGFRAGMVVGLGIWISDVLFIASVFWGLNYVSQIANATHFKLYLGIIGGILLILIGLGTMLSKKQTLDYEKTSLKKTTYLQLFIKGFLVNTLNPFTVFFWLGLISTAIIESHYTNFQILLYVLGIMGTIIFTDSLKILLAKKIKKYLKPIHVLWFRRIAGAALVLFGIVLMYRVF